MKFPGLDHDIGFNPFHLDEILDFSSKKSEKELYLLFGSKDSEKYPVLVKMRLESLQQDFYNRLVCMVVEIDGNALSAEQIQKRAVILEKKDPPTKGEQWRALMETLENNTIAGTPVLVTERYVEGHMRLVRMRRETQRNSTERRQ